MKECYTHLLKLFLLQFKKLRENFELFDMLIYKVFGNYNLLNHVSIETVRSYDGRFLDINKSGDSGWINFYYNFQTLPTILLCVKIFGLLIYAIKKRIHCNCLEAKIKYGFSISFFIFYSLVYFIMKAFMFPVIIMLSIALIYALILCFDEDINEMQKNCSLNYLIEKA